MKKAMAWLVAMGMLLAMGMTAAAQTATDVGEGAQIDVNADKAEQWDENTHLVEEVDGSFTLTTDEGTLSVRVESGTLPEGARLMVVEIPQGSEGHDWIATALTDKGEQPLAYDIFFYQDGQRIPFAGTLEMTLPLPEVYTRPQLFHLSTEGAASALSTQPAQDGAVTFSTEQTGYFVLANEPVQVTDPTDDPDPTGDSKPVKDPDTGAGGMTLWALLALLGALGMGLSVRRKGHC